MGSLPLLQGIFPTQGSNPGLPHCRQILYRLSHQENLIMKVEVPFINLFYSRCFYSRKLLWNFPGICLRDGKLEKRWKLRSLEERLFVWRKICQVLSGAEDPVLAVRWRPNPRRLNYSSGEETGGVRKPQCSERLRLEFLAWESAGQLVPYITSYLKLQASLNSLNYKFLQDRTTSTPTPCRPIARHVTGPRNEVSLFFKPLGL